MWCQVRLCTAHVMTGTVPYCSCVYRYSHAPLMWREVLACTAHVITSTVMHCSCDDRYGHALLIWRHGWFCTCPTTIYTVMRLTCVERCAVLHSSCDERYGHAMIMWWQERPCSDHIVLQSTGKIGSYVFCGFKSLYEKTNSFFNICSVFSEVCNESKFYITFFPLSSPDLG